MDHPFDGIGLRRIGAALFALGACALMTPHAAASQTEPAPTNIFACLVPGTGVVYVVGAEGACVRPSHIPLSWNQKGPKGEPGRGVAGATLLDDGSLELTMTDDTKVNAGSARGRDGVSVGQASLNEAGDLVITFSDGRSINAGRARGPEGTPGRGVKGATVLEDGTLELTLSDDSKVNAAGNARGPQGPQGSGVKAAAVLEDGTLEMTLDDDTKFNASGNARGPQGPRGNDGSPGPKGDPGANGRGIKSAAVLEDGTLELTLDDDGKLNASGNARGPQGPRGNDGSPGAKGDPGPKGDPGANGRGIKSAAVLEDGTLELTLDDETKFNASGNARGPQGPEGNDGLPGPKGDKGDKGDTGRGLACWDTNEDGVQDVAEDTNNDGLWNNQDCRGANGKDGARGNDGISEYQLVPGTPFSVAAGSAASGSVSCPSPKKALGGGFTSGSDLLFLVSASLDATSYSVRAVNTGDAAATMTFQVVCARAN